MSSSIGVLNENQKADSVSDHVMAYQNSPFLGILFIKLIEQYLFIYNPFQLSLCLFQPRFPQYTDEKISLHHLPFCNFDKTQVIFSRYLPSLLKL